LKKEVKKMKNEEFNLTQPNTIDLIHQTKNYLMIRRFVLILALMLFVLPFVSLAQSAPVHTRYAADERWSMQDCMARAKWALETEGYKINWTGSDIYRANKDVYSAIVLCDPTPEGNMRVNVIIAGANSTAAENDRLWTRLRNPGMDGTSGGARPGVNERPDGTSQSYNLALNRPAQQSSIYSGVDRTPQGGVDGVKDGGFGFHTNNEQNPWWQVDLGKIVGIGEIVIYNRLDCCPERARTIQIFLSDDGSNWTRVFANDGTIFGGKNDSKPLRVLFSNGKTARFVRLQLNETNYLHLDEVEIYPVYHAD
jgi:hypothetical protein